MIHAADNAEGMGYYSVGAGRSQVAGAESFKDLVCETVGGGERDLKCLGVRDAGAVQVRRGNSAFGGEQTDLVGGSVHQYDPDVQRPQDRYVEQQIWEDIIRDDHSIYGDDEGLFTETRDVAEDSAQVGWFHQ